jgi:hypothetical protein
MIWRGVTSRRRPVFANSPWLQIAVDLQPADSLSAGHCTGLRRGIYGVCCVYTTPGTESMSADGQTENSSSSSAVARSHPVFPRPRAGDERAANANATRRGPGTAPLPPHLTPYRHAKGRQATRSQVYERKRSQMLAGRRRGQTCGKEIYRTRVAGVFHAGGGRLRFCGCQTGSAALKSSDVGRTFAASLHACAVQYGTSGGAFRLRIDVESLSCGRPQGWSRVGRSLHSLTCRSKR